MQKRYLIVGGSSGIGLAVAKKLRGETRSVMVVGSNQEKLFAINTLYPDILTLQSDLSDPHNVAGLFEQIKPMMGGGKLDGMVYAAGISPLCLLKDNTVELSERVFSVNYFSFLECCRFFYMPDFGKEGSRIVAVSSVTSKGAGYRQILYGSSKEAMNSAVRLLAHRFMERRIVINSILPGVVNTDIFQRLCLKSNNLIEKTKQRQLLGILEPQEVAEQIILMLSDDYRVTGHEVYFDAGWNIVE